MSDGKNKTRFTKLKLFKWVVVSGLLALAVVYLMLAYWPSSAEGDKERAIAVASVNEMLVVGPRLHSGDTTTSLPKSREAVTINPVATSQAVADVAHAEKIDFVKAVRQLNERILTPDVRFRIRVGAMHWTAMSFKPEEVETAGTITLTAIRPEIHERILKTAITLDRAPAFDAASTTQSLAPRDRERMIDEAESFLLRRADWKIPDFTNLPPHLPSGGLCQLAALAILRADRRGESGKAAGLLESALEAVRIMHTARYPESGYNYLYLQETGESRPSQDRYRNFYLNLAPLLVVGECSGLTGAALARADAILNHSLITPEQVAALVDANIARARQIARTLPLPRRHNGWHRFMGGIPEQVVYSACKPIWSNHFEQVTDFMSRKNISPYKNHFSTLCMALFMASNVEIASPDIGFSLLPLMNPAVVAGNNREMFNQDVHLARVALAAARWRAEHGQWPAGLGDLVPTYLDRSYLSPAVGWTVLLMPPVESGPDWTVGKPVFCHFEKTNRFIGKMEFSLRIGVPGRVADDTDSAAM